MSITLQERFAAIVSLENVLCEEADLLEYGRDWTRKYAPSPLLIVRPRSTEEVAQCVRLCLEENIKIVPSGGRTGLSGGAIANAGEVVLSLEKMNRLGEVDSLGRLVHVQAGVVTEAVHQHCEKSDLTWPVDFASKGSSQVGGNIATNAGGVRVIRYGSTRSWVKALTVVTGEGEVLRLGGKLEKNNVGPAMKDLFIGSEGILGIITEATLALTTLPDEPKVIFFGLESMEAVLALFRSARSQRFTINAFEFADAASLARMMRHRSADLGMEAMAFHVLIEIEGDEAKIETWLESLFEQEIVADGVLAQNEEQAARLWLLREGISESLSATGLPHKNDVSVPIANLSDFCQELVSFFETYESGFELCLFGHIGDGNIHVNIMKPETMTAEDFHQKSEERDHRVFDIVRRYDGSPSAEHGIGLMKKHGLSYIRSDAEISMLRKMKAVFDPKGIMNPNKVIEL